MPSHIKLASSNHDAFNEPLRLRAHPKRTLMPSPSKPPRWLSRPSKERWSLIAFGSFLALLAGYINGTTVFGDFGTSVSHTTGSSTLLGIALVEAQVSSIGLYASLVAAFMMGGVVAGAIVGDQSFRWSRKYGWVLMLESLSIVCAYADMHTAWDAGKHAGIARGAIWAAFACGLQNAITTTFSGAVIRTTHMTGLLTDIGVVIGQAIFHQEQGKEHLWKLSVFVPLYVSFVLGGCVAVLGHRASGDEAGLLIVAGILFLAGASQSLYRFYHDWAERRRMRIGSEAECRRTTEEQYRDDVATV